MSADFVHQDDCFDDDSDVPSHWDPSEELDESLLEEEVDHESEPKHVEMEFDDEETETESSSSACITEDWNEVKLDGDVTITDDCVDSELMDTLRIHAKHVLHNVDQEIKSFSRHDVGRLEPEVQLYHCFAESTLWRHLLRMINTRLPRNEVRCELRELELLLRFIFAIAVYNISPSRVFADLEIYPLAADIVGKFVGDGQKRISVLLKALDPQKTSPDAVPGN
jgi:hypothetical protein